LRLGRVDQPVVMRVAISYTSCDAAWANLHAECDRPDFDAIRQQARDEWNQWLGRIEVDGGDPQRRARFYTDLFFALAGRRTCSDADGTYIDNTGPTPVVRQIPLDENGRPRYRHFNSDSFWGAQWTITPLWSIAYPRIVDEFCRCFLDMYRNGGLIPRGPSGGNYTFVMTSAQSTPLLVSAIHNGILRCDDTDGIDINEVYAALHKNHMPGGLMSKCGYEHNTCQGGGIEDYLTLGCIPEPLPKVGFHNNGAAQTLEHAFNDWCLAQLCRTVGKRADADEFLRRSRNYRHLFDSSIGFMRPWNRNVDSWFDEYDPMNTVGWTEATGWTYTFYVPHDVPGLIDCFGSADRFTARLEEALEKSAKHQFKATHGTHNDNTLDFGNEPALATPYLFHAAGKPDRSEYWVQRILSTLKSGNAPTDGFGGDEDQGMMGAWNVLASIGLFTVNGLCDPHPALSVLAPQFERIVIHLDPRYYKGQAFVIRSQGLAPGKICHIASADLNGQPLPANRQLTMRDLTSGGELRLNLRA
jgi:predicted alpha-1,2-mannosidase